MKQAGSRKETVSIERAGSRMAAEVRKQGVLRRKLTSKSGMTLTETLTALAIVSILCTTIVIGTNAAVSVYRKSVQLSESQTLLSTLSQSLSGELRYAKNIRTVTDIETGTEKVVYDSEAFGSSVSVIGESTDGVIRVGTEGKKYDLLGAGAYTSGLKAKVTVAYANGIFTVTVIVTGPVPGERKAEFTVRAMNS